MRWMIRAFSGYAKPTPIVPVLVGATSQSSERRYGALLAPYLADNSNIFIVSSDFAHWGLRFRYTYYVPNGFPRMRNEEKCDEVNGLECCLLGGRNEEEGESLYEGVELEAGSAASSSNVSSGSQPSRKSRKTSETLSRGYGMAPDDPPIHESIKRVDMHCIAACETGSIEKWWHALKGTQNTVCGRHPIGVVMAGLEELTKPNGVLGGTNGGRFKFVRYERSGECKTVKDSSVSYASAYAVV